MRHSATCTSKHHVLHDASSAVLQESLKGCYRHAHAVACCSRSPTCAKRCFLMVRLPPCLACEGNRAEATLGYPQGLRGCKLMSIVTVTEQSQQSTLIAVTASRCFPAAAEVLYSGWLLSLGRHVVHLNVAAVQPHRQNVALLRVEVQAHNSCRGNRDPRELCHTLISLVHAAGCPVL